MAAKSATAEVEKSEILKAITKILDVKMDPINKKLSNLDPI